MPHETNLGAVTGEAGTSDYSSFPPPGIAMVALLGASQAPCVRSLHLLHSRAADNGSHRCENACGQKRTLQNFHLDLRCILKQHEFIVLGKDKKASRRGCILFAHKHPMSQGVSRVANADYCRRRPLLEEKLLQFVCDLLQIAIGQFANLNPAPAPVDIANLLH